jgi:hypothetical protein
LEQSATAHFFAERAPRVFGNRRKAAVAGAKTESRKGEGRVKIGRVCHEDDSAARAV